VKEGLDFLRARLGEKKVDAIVLIGDDQEENFKEENLPQISLYLGEKVFSTEPGENGRKRGALYRCHAELAQKLADGLLEREFDVAFSRFFPNDELLSHAHCQILRTMTPGADIPVVLVFVNAFNLPALRPRRCYQLGRAIKEIIDGLPSGERIALYASGGLSHFPSSYPFRHYRGPYTLGSISVDFDRRAVELMTRGEGEKLGQLSAEALLDNGGLEMKNWLVLLGAVENAVPQLLVYEAFYSAIMGMGVGYWELE
jgi:aromatic ring-opening dioxygenase catalytic subunit (LigB family)